MQKLLAALVSFSVLGPLSTSHGFELNFDSHFAFHVNQPQWNAQYVIPYMAQIGTTFIRDDVDWNNIEHTAQGVFGLTSDELAFLQLAHQNGIKVVGLVQAGGAYSSPFYTNKFDVAAYANACAWLAAQLNADGTPLVAAIEILNEPNNDFASYYGGYPFVVDSSQWQQKYVTLANAAYAAIKAANPSMTVLAGGAQGSDLLLMLSLGLKCDGITFHPYDDGSAIPERVYEPEADLGYESWIARIRAAAPNIPMWETERGADYSVSEYSAALWNARRYLMSFGMGVEHTFFYEMIGDGEFSGVGQSWLSFYDNSRQVSTVLPRILGNLGGLHPTTRHVTLVSTQSGFDTTDFKSYVWTVTRGRTVAAVWFGNQVPHKVNVAPAPQNCTVSFTLDHAHSYNGSSVLDLISGATEPVLEPGVANPNGLPQWTAYYGSIANIYVSEQPLLIVVR
ncbi:MAG TPA: cellulase family glycosylhydrolase [Chthoniobacterales bacterium]|nr:cellulase family glycosylhydrolase [Chthoniobacterales bacterium]